MKSNDKRTRSFLSYFCPGKGLDVRLLAAAWEKQLKQSQKQPRHLPGNCGARTQDMLNLPGHQTAPHLHGLFSLGFSGLTFHLQSKGREQEAGSPEELDCSQCPAWLALCVRRVWKGPGMLISSARSSHHCRAVVSHSHPPTALPTALHAFPQAPVVASHLGTVGLLCV